MSPTPAGVFARKVVSSSSVSEPSSATTKVWISLTSVDGCAVSMLSMPNAGDPSHASDAASSKQRFTSNDLERMEGGFYLHGQRPIVSQARGSLCLCAAQACSLLLPTGAAPDWA